MTALTGAAFMLQYHLAEAARKRERNLKIAKAVASIPGKTVRLTGKVLTGTGKAIAAVGKGIGYTFTTIIPKTVESGIKVSEAITEHREKYKEYKTYQSDMAKANAALDGRVSLEKLTPRQLQMARVIYHTDRENIIRRRQARQRAAQTVQSPLEDIAQTEETETIQTPTQTTTSYETEIQEGESDSLFYKIRKCIRDTVGSIRGTHKRETGRARQLRERRERQTRQTADEQARKEYYTRTDSDVYSNVSQEEQDVLDTRLGGSPEAGRDMRREMAEDVEDEGLTREERAMLDALVGNEIYGETELALLDAVGEYVAEQETKRVKEQADRELEFNLAQIPLGRAEDVMTDEGLREYMIEESKRLGMNPVYKVNAEGWPEFYCTSPVEPATESDLAGIISPIRRTREERPSDDVMNFFHPSTFNAGLEYPETAQENVEAREGIREIKYKDTNGNDQVRYFDGRRFVKADGSYTPKTVEEVVNGLTSAESILTEPTTSETNDLETMTRYTASTKTRDPKYTIVPCLGKEKTKYSSMPKIGGKKIKIG